MLSKVNTTYKIDTVYFRGTIEFVNDKFTNFLLEKKINKSLESDTKGSIIFQTNSLFEISHLKSIIDDVFKYDKEQK